MKLLTNISEYTQIVNTYRQKDCYTNDYIQQNVVDLILSEALYAECYKRNAFLFVKKEVGVRMYYYLNDLEEKVNFKMDDDIMVEILFRGFLPSVEMEYLTSCGFRVNLIRDQYGATYQELKDQVCLVGNVIVETAQTLQAVKMACELFNDSFDRLSGDFISENEYSMLLDSKSIIVAKSADRTHFLGALHQVRNGNVNTIGHVAVIKSARGMGVGRALIDAFVEWNMESEKTRYQLWVQRNNTIAINMYVNKGFRFLKKSTISMINSDGR